MHESSGITNNQLHAIKKGLNKIKLAAEIKNIFMESLQKELKDSGNIDLRQVFSKATTQATALVEEKLRTINFNNYV
jgi:fructose-bisphosphate aldolase class II/tagatose 1,6-diphosphate aldolase GatY/KbaY